MGKKRINTDSSDFERMYKSFVEGSYDKQFDEMVQSSPFKDNSYEDDEVDLTNEDYLDADINPYTYKGGLDLEAEDPFNEIRAEAQGGWSELGAGLGRTASKIGREVIKTAGAVGGAAVGLVGQTDDLLSGEDNTDFLSTTFNNSFIKAVDAGFDQFNQSTMPVYVKSAVENGDFFDKITSGEFYATEGADGVGYMISAFGPGLAAKSLGLGNKIFGGLQSVSKLKYGKNIEKARKAMGLSTDKIDELVIPAFNTVFESGAEGKGVEDTLNTPENITKYQEANRGSEQHQAATLKRLSELDKQRQSGQIDDGQYNSMSQAVSEDALEDMRKATVSEAVRNTVIKNIGILAGPNYMMAKIMYGKNAAKNLSKKVTDKVIDGADSKSGSFIGKAFEAAQKPGAIKHAGKEFGKGVLSEGSEEIAQSSVEHRNVEDAIDRDLGYYANTFVSDFAHTLSTTDGQVAGFLGGILGGPMSAYQGYKQYKKDKIKEDELLDKIRGAGTTLNDLTLPLYQTRRAKDPTTGEEFDEVIMDENGPVQNKENIIKVGQSIKHHEDLSNEYDKAVAKGDVETVEAIVKKAEHDTIMSFINEDEVSIDALKQHLEATMPSGEGIDKQTSLNNQKRREGMLDKANFLRKEMISFRDMAANVIKLDAKNSTPEEIDAYMRQLGSDFLNKTSEAYDIEKNLTTLKETQSLLDKKTIFKEMDNPLYVEGVSHELDKKTTERYNPRLDFVNDQIEKNQKRLNGIERFINEEIWTAKLNNKAFNEAKTTKENLSKKLSEEEVAKTDVKLAQIKSTTELTDLDQIKDEGDVTVKEALAKRRKEILDEKRTARDAQQQKEAEDQEFEDEANEGLGDIYDDLYEEATSEDETEEEVVEEVEEEAAEEIPEDEIVEEVPPIEEEVVEPANVPDKLFKDLKVGDIIQHRTGEEHREATIIEIDKKNREINYETVKVDVTQSYEEFAKEYKVTMPAKRGRKKKEVTIIDPLTDSEVTVVAQDKNSITVEDNTGAVKQYPKSKKEPGNGSSDEVPINDFNPVAESAVTSDSKAPGIEQINPDAYEAYLMQSRDKTGDIISFSVNSTGQQGKYAEALNRYNELVKTNFADMRVEDRTLLIEYLPILLNYNVDGNTVAKSRTNNRLPGDKLLRTNIINELAKGIPLNLITTTVKNQESGSFNTRKEKDNKTPVRNNVLELYDFTEIDPKDLANQISFYHINQIGEPIRISNALAEFHFSNGRVKPDLSGEIFVLLKHPKGYYAPAKLNTNKLESKKANALAYIYAALLEDPELRIKSIESKDDNPLLQDLVQFALADEIRLLGNDISTVKFGQLIEFLVVEDSGHGREIIVNPATEQFAASVEFSDNVYRLDTPEDIARFSVDLATYKKQSVITITDEKNSSIPNINFQNSNYIHYLLQDKVLSTDIATGGERSFIQATDYKAPNKIGSEVWISSTVSKPAEKTLKENPGDEIKERLNQYEREAELSRLINISSAIDISRLEPTPIRIHQIAKGLDIKLPEEDNKGSKLLRQLSLSGGIEYKNIQEWLDSAQSIVDAKIANEKNKLDFTRNSQNNSVSLQEVKIENDMDIPTTQDNIDYKKTLEAAAITGNAKAVADEHLNQLAMLEDTLSVDFMLDEATLAMTKELHAELTTKLNAFFKENSIQPIKKC